MAKSTVMLPNDLEVVVVRDFRAPRAAVYEAFTKPSLITRWMLGPPGWTMPVCDMDLRVGGAYHWRWRNDSGAEFGFTGVFREVTRLSRIVHTQLFDPGTLGGTMGAEALITSEFSERAGVTTYKTTIRYQSKADRDAAVSTGMTNGMEQGYVRLDALLATTAADG